MPRDKDFKRRVRARMQKTGEAYTTARAHLLQKSKTPQPAVPEAEAASPLAPGTVTPDTGAGEPPEPMLPGAPTPDAYAELAGMADATIEAKTGRTWGQWVATLDVIGAGQMPHRDIARIVNEQYEVGGWWAQTVTVGYERIKGLREKGQHRGGSFEANKSKTFDVPIEVLFDACADEVTRHRWLSAADYQVTTATRPRSLRLRWHDGGIVTFWFMEKGAAKSTLSVQHTKLPDRAAAEQLKAFWSERLDALGQLLRNR